MYMVSVICPQKELNGIEIQRSKSEIIFKNTIEINPSNDLFIELTDLILQSFLSDNLQRSL